MCCWCINTNTFVWTRDVDDVAIAIAIAAVAIVFVGVFVGVAVAATIAPYWDIALIDVLRFDQLLYGNCAVVVRK